MRLDKSLVMSVEDLRRELRLSRKTWGMFVLLSRMSKIDKAKLRAFRNGQSGLDPVKRERLTIAFALLKSGKITLETHDHKYRGKQRLVPVYRETNEKVETKRPLFYPGSVLVALGRGAPCLISTANLSAAKRCPPCARQLAPPWTGLIARTKSQPELEPQKKLKRPGNPSWISGALSTQRA